MSLRKCHTCKDSRTKKHTPIIVASIGLIILGTKIGYCMANIVKEKCGKTQ